MAATTQHGRTPNGNTLDNTFKHRNCTNGQVLRSGSKLIEAGDYTSIKQGRPVWQPEGIMVVTIDLWETRMDPKAQCGIYSSNVSKPQKHLTSPLPACCREQNDTNRKYCSAAGRVAELNNHYCKSSCV